MNISICAMSSYDGKFIMGTGSDMCGSLLVKDCHSHYASKVLAPSSMGRKIIAVHSI